MIAIIDYGMGNVRSVANMLRKIGRRAQLTGDPDVIAGADALILPGVGTFDRGIRNLEERGLIDVLHHLVLDKGKPALGICLGMQLMTRGSEEGRLPGLRWFEADTRRFKVDQSGLRVPHMGWNLAAPTSPSPLWADQPSDTRFYFVHSYHVVPDSEADALCRTDYGGPFVSGIRKEHVVGVQFHPEKSHVFGMRFLTNFVNRYC